MRVEFWDTRYTPAFLIAFHLYLGKWVIGAGLLNHWEWAPRAGFNGLVLFRADRHPPLFFRLFYRHNGGRVCSSNKWINRMLWAIPQKGKS